MTNQSPHPKSMSPHNKPPTSAFQWPIPQQSGSSEISIREILDHYGNDPELLKCILTAKSEEDKVKIKLSSFFFFFFIYNTKNISRKNQLETR